MTWSGVNTGPGRKRDDLTTCKLQREVGRLHIGEPCHSVRIVRTKPAISQKYLAHRHGMNHLAGADQGG